MCDPLTATLIASTVIAGGTAIKQMTQGAPKMPAAPQEAKSPTADAFRRKNAAAVSPGAAMATSQGTMLGAGAGPSQNVGTSTLLGQ